MKWGATAAKKLTLGSASATVVGATVQRLPGRVALAAVAANSIGHGEIMLNKRFTTKLRKNPGKGAWWSAPLGVDRYEAVQLAICRACSSSKLTGLLYPSAEWRRLAL